MAIMDLISFAVYHGVPEKCFVGLDGLTLPVYDETQLDCANMLTLYRWAIKRAIQPGGNTEKLGELAFESAFRVIAMIEEAREEEVDFETLRKVYDNDETAKWTADVYMTVAKGYLDGTYVAFDVEKAKSCIVEAQAFFRLFCKKNR